MAAATTGCVALVVTALTSAGGAARADGIPSAVLAPEVVANVEARMVAGRVVGLAVALVGPEDVRYATFGRRSQDDPAPVRLTSVFEVGSVTKVFTALLLAAAALRGEVGLDDRVASLLPGPERRPSPARSITLRQLAQHTSGLPRMPPNFAPRELADPYADYGPDLLRAFLDGCELARPPGAAYEYSNLGAGLLGHALALRLGRPYEEALRERVLGPLGLRDTIITLSPGQRARFVTGHADGVAVPPWTFGCLAGCYALRSTVVDLARFVQANLGSVESGGLRGAMDLARRGRVPTGVPGLSIALGWHVTTRAGVELVWHNGGTGGSHAFVGFVPARGRGVVVLSNTNEDVDDLGLHLLEPSVPLAVVPPAVRLAPEVLARYAGRYERPGGPSFDVLAAPPGLRVRLTGQGFNGVYPRDARTFAYRVVAAAVEFDLDAAGVPTALVLRQGSTVLRAERVAGGDVGR